MKLTNTTGKPRFTLKLILILALAFAMATTLAACSPRSDDAGASGGGAESADVEAPDEGGEDAAAPDGQASGDPVRIGSKDFTENLVLGELYALALEDKGGIPVERKFSLASAAVHTALVDDEIDLYPEYTGTGLLSVLQLPLETDPQKVYDTVKKEYADQFNLVWLAYGAANDSQGLVVTKEASDKYGLTTISDLQKNAKDIRFLSQGEFDEREDGIPALEAAYGPFDWKSSVVIDNALKYTAMKNGEGDAAPAYTTEGYLVDPDFVLLEDD
ncbi:MAG: hypothetical protein LBL54_04910, partial [Clostridiales Family XIII bacterium]|nr:hypothetical protein [Clostridiales Family XIII bacterium]